MSETAIGTVKNPEQGEATAPREHHKRKMSSVQRREMIAAYIFLAPTLLGFLIFVVGPLIAGLGLSFTHYDFFSPVRFAGFQNFLTLARDSRFRTIFGNTVYYVVGMVLLDLVWALALATALNSQIPKFLKVIFRAVFFFPVLTSGAVIAIVWSYLFNTDLGIINWFLSQFGIDKIPWLISSQWVKPSIVLATVWNGVGFNMILLLSGMQSIPRTLYEAAEIDGAGKLSRFRYITLPLLTPTIFFILIKGLIGVFQLFDTPYNLGGGGPGDASRTIVMYIYEMGFKTMRLGYASTIALALFVALLVLTIFQNAISRKWVFYR